MDSISTARDFFINQQGLSPDQADMIVSKGMEAYNQQNQPQSMMQMASGGIARLGYGFGNLVKGSGVAEPVSGGDTSGGGFGGMGLMGKLIQQNPQMFRRVETARSNFIDVNQNGIDDRQEAAYGGRIGYQMGGSPMGVGTMPMDTGQSLQVPQQMPTNFSSAQSITSNPLLNYGQPQIGQAGGTPLSMNRGGIARLGYESGGVTLPSQGSEMSQMQGMNQEQALQTIIQILIENGVPPEQAQQLALQIIQIFAQGGEPAVEAFANQLEQEEVQAMAQGGVAGYAYRQGYGFGGIGKIFSGAAKAVSGVVKGVAKAVKAVAKSPIGRAALTIGAATFLGPGAFGFSGLGLTGAGLGLATAAANAGLQKLGGGKFSLLEAGLSGLSAGLSNPTVPTTSASNITIPGADVANTYNAVGVGNTTIPADVGSYAGSVQNVYGDPGMISSTALETYGPGGMPNVGPVTDAAKAYTNPTVMDKISQFGDTAKAGITNLYQDPLGTIQRVAGSAFDYANDPKNLGTIATVGGLSGLALLGSQLGVPRNEGEDDDSYAKRLQDTQGYITQYGRNLQIKNPYFYQREGAVNPFAPTMAANGGIMGYKKGGSMVPPARQIEGGVIELDARKTGGYIPYGKKERVDDVPAMLAKDEFVFTSRAVKAAGGGSAQRGAKKMYALMKQLEAKGARA
jgi:hypothetical protein